MGRRRLLPVLHALLDAWAMAIAAFATVGLLRAWVVGGDDGSWIWLGGEALPRAAIVATLAVFAAGALLRVPGAAVPARLASGLLALVCLSEAAAVHAWAQEERILHGLPVPASAVTGLALLAWAWAGPAAWPSPWRPRLARAAAVSTMAGLSLAAHMLVVGATDHGARWQEYDAIVVLGAKVHRDGRPSGALEDRTREACRRYHAAVAAGRSDMVLVLSGGRDPLAPLSEPQAMAGICREEGVPDAALVEDPTGVTTAATAEAVARLARERGWRSILAVSHDYHLARMQAAFRSAGVRGLVAPCEETHPWPGKPVAMAREVAALVVYLMR